MTSSDDSNPASGNADGAAPDKAALDASAARSRAIATSLGAIVSIMMRSPEHRSQSLADIEGLVGPPLAADQFAIVEARDPNSGIVAPVAAVTWAMVSDEVEKRLSDISIARPRLEPKEWRSGPLPWIITAVGDQRALAALIDQLVKSRFPGKLPKIRIRDKEGNPRIGHVSVAGEVAGGA